MTGELPNGNFELFEFAQKSAQSVNDLGSYRECLATADSSYYLTSVTVGYIKLFFGLCVPEECQLSEYHSVNEFLAKTMYESAPPGTVPPLTGDNVQIYESKKENLRVSSWGPLSIVSVLIVCALSLCVFLGTAFSVCEYYNERKRQL